MKSNRILFSAFSLAGAVALLSAAATLVWPLAPARRTGPGVQAAQDAKEPEVLASCRNPPPARGGRGAGAGRAPAAPAEAGPKDYTVAEIPCVIAAGQKWKEVWDVHGNNAEGIIGTKDGGLLIAQNDDSAVVKPDRNGKASVVYSGTNTGGALSMNTKGVVTKYGDNLRTNGIILSRDEKTLYVTNGPTLAAFDVQPDGSLTNQREFARLEGGGNGDGSTIDSEGRIYVSSNPGVQVIGPDGKYLGLIPTPRDIISVAFSGPGKKTLYAVSRDGARNEDWIIAIPTLSQGYKGRSK